MKVGLVVGCWGSFLQ